MLRSATILARLPGEKMAAALELIDFMLGEALAYEDADKVLAELAARIRGAGVPLDRLSSIVPLLHAEAVASARFWEHGKGVRSYLFPYSEESGEGYAHSPAADVHRTGEWVELWLPDTPDEKYGIVPELKQDGYTGYAMAPVFMKSGMNGTFSFATKAGAGFSAGDMAFLRAVFPALAACQDIIATNRVLREVTRMYLGEEPHRRILSGDVHRGEVMHIRSAILFADMRDFTGITARMSAEAAVRLLNGYYDCIVPPVEAAGGEVLKFIGDGILAIFRADGHGREICAAALEAAQAGLGRVAARSADPQFRVGIALHYGEVAFGNVGSGMRLDYTVIGRDVNLAARLAGLCGPMEEPLLASEAFCTRAGIAARPLGLQSLRGLQSLQAVFALPAGDAAS
ncbi:adenylate/guanylate cyclase domain-containing protein [Roseobacteraceae bacterium NS-SX3]